MTDPTPNEDYCLLCGEDSDECLCPDNDDPYSTGFAYWGDEDDDESERD